MGTLPDDVLARTMLEQANRTAAAALASLVNEHYGRVDYRVLYLALGNIRSMVDSARLAAYRQAVVQGKRPVGAPPRKPRKVQMTLEV